MTDISRTETAAVLAMGINALAVAGDIARAQGHSQPMPDEIRDIAVEIERVVTAVIVGLRDPGDEVTIADYSASVNAIAAAAVERVLGLPPAATKAPN